METKGIFYLIQSLRTVVFIKPFTHANKNIWIEMKKTPDISI